MKAQVQRTLLGYAFASPWLLGLVVFISYPFLAGLYFSFCDYPPLKGPLFVGLDNYAELAADKEFHRSLGVTMIFAAVAIPMGVVAALSLAVLLNARIRGQSFYRVIFYLPHLVPTVVVAILWMWIFNPEFGLFNIVLKGLLQAVDGWTGVWFDLDRAVAGMNFLRPQALALLAIPGIAALVWSPRFGAAFRRVPKLHRLLKAAAVVGFVLGGVALLNASLHWLMPVDMQKVRWPGWLSDGNPFPSAVFFAPSWALWALVVMSLWGVGQMGLIYLAKLQDVPAELYEAAELDGANWWHKTWHVTLPMISPVILFNVVMAIIGTFQVFVEPYIMTQGGPEGKTRFVALFVYDNAFQYQRLGYASAVAWVLFLVIVVLTVVAFRCFRKRVYYAGR